MMATGQLQFKYSNFRATEMLDVEYSRSLPNDLHLMKTTNNTGNPDFTFNCKNVSKKIK